MAPPSSTRAAAGGSAAAAALDCSVCFLALKAPPVFQCNAGHVICSSCRDKMSAAGRCRACRAIAPAGARGYGYRHGQGHGRERRTQPSRVARCGCPVEACCFAGSMTALVAHFTAAHGWPCTTGVCSGESCDVRLHYGINVVAVDREYDVVDDDDDHLKKAATQNSRYLLVFNVARGTLGRAVSAFCIRPRTAADEPHPSFWAPPKPVRCQVSLTYSRYVPSRRGLVRCYFQRTNADVGCTDCTDCLPDPDNCFQTTVHNSDDQDEDDDTVEVTIRVTIHQ